MTTATTSALLHRSQGTILNASEFGVFPLKDNQKRDSIAGSFLPTEKAKVDVKCLSDQAPSATTLCLPLVWNVPPEINLSSCKNVVWSYHWTITFDVGPFQFLVLPLELRIMVYKLICSSLDTGHQIQHRMVVYKKHLASKKYAVARELPSKLIAMLFVNRQIYEEFAPIFYGHFDFRFPDMVGLRMFLIQIRHNRHHLREITVRFNYRTHANDRNESEEYIMSTLTGIKTLKKLTIVAASEGDALMALGYPELDIAVPFLVSQKVVNRRLVTGLDLLEVEHPPGKRTTFHDKVVARLRCVIARVTAESTQ